MRMPVLLSVMLLATLAGCTPDDAGNTVVPVADETAVAPDSVVVAEAVPELANTAWRLLNIAEMDDSTDTPNDSSKYTLSFGADGKVSMLADCNRGTGSWTSESPGQLQFGPIATTRALCPPDSQSEKYLAQFEWVRSYVLKDGHLFLATMADGSIIEFEPLPPVVATLFDEEIRAGNAAELQGRLLTGLFDRYAADRGLRAEGPEIDAFIENMKRGMAAQGLTAGEDDLTAEEAAQVNTMRREMGRAMIRQWKINKSLYEAFGGRIIYQQLGPEPLDAYRQYLEERRDAGDFTIADQAMADAFWKYFTDDSIHDFMEPGSEEAENAFAEPPWEK